MSVRPLTSAFLFWSRYPEVDDNSLRKFYLWYSLKVTRWCIKKLKMNLKTYVKKGIQKIKFHHPKDPLKIIFHSIITRKIESVELNGPLPINLGKMFRRISWKNVSTNFSVKFVGIITQEAGNEERKRVTVDATCSRVSMLRNLCPMNLETLQRVPSLWSSRSNRLDGKGSWNFHLKRENEIISIATYGLRLVILLSRIVNRDLRSSVAVNHPRSNFLALGLIDHLANGRARAPALRINTFSV